MLKEKQSLVAMESCGGTHYWARYAKQAGHHIKAINALKGNHSGMLSELEAWWHKVQREGFTT